MGFGPLHIAQQHVGRHGFGHEVRVPQQLPQGLGLLFAAVEQVFPGGQHTYDIVDILIVHREAAQPAFLDGAADGFLVVVDPDGGHVGAVGHAVGGGQIAELKHVLDHFPFVAFDHAGFLADIHHGLDLFLGHFLLGVGIDTEQAHQPPGGGLLHGGEGGHDPVGPHDQGLQMQGHLLAAAAADLFRRQLAQRHYHRRGDQAKYRRRGPIAQARFLGQPGADGPEQQQKKRSQPAQSDHGLTPLQQRQQLFRPSAVGGAQPAFICICQRRLGTGQQGAQDQQYDFSQPSADRVFQGNSLPQHRMEPL